ncbi:hypothetical protein TGDOM2_248440 [Toxoplasma gondii GAB2-2007-GAL-DOM2]|uniref:Uncharacterized protein n=2 Tax=Toxoplasma gondii TaxID=5811 RepID=A0A086LBR7_TOXGO|nr:hypothetical protein TGDOM2_248440 [Toxoplasma gondii GAB2-2007-GAL-DOM2]KFG54085.1 hypothetical protein TGFOU_248440 [Toxoplasma gondii FOU]
MDGLSRQNFWNELSCCLLLLQNIERYNSYMHDLCRAAAGLPSLPHLPVGLHGLGNRSPTSLLSENDTRTLTVVSATLCGEGTGPAPSPCPTAPEQLPGVTFDRSTQRLEETCHETMHPQKARSSGKVPLPCTRLPDALSSSTLLPIPLQMLKIVLIAPRLLAWGYLWERRLLRRIRNPLPVYYPPDHFGTEAILCRADRMPDTGVKVVSHKPKTTATPGDAPRTYQPFTSVIPILVDREMTTKLVQICKRKKAGLHGLIISTASVAISELMWNRKTVLKEIDSMLENKQYMRKATETSAQTHHDGHDWLPFHPFESAGRVTAAFGPPGATKQGRNCGFGSNMTSENAEPTESANLSNKMEENCTVCPTPTVLSPTRHRPVQGPTKNNRFPDNAVRGRLSPENQLASIVKPSSSIHGENEYTVDSRGVSVHNYQSQNTQTDGKHVDRDPTFAQSAAAHRPSRCRRGSGKQDTVSCASIRGKRMWGTWSAAGAACKRARYAFEQLQAMMRRPTCELNPDRLGASHVENHTGPVYLYSLQAVSGRRWFKHTKRDEFEPTEFEDQMLFQSFLLEQAQAVLPQLAPGDPFGIGHVEEMETRSCNFKRDTPLLFWGKCDENQNTQASSRRVTLPNFQLSLSPSAKPGTGRGVSLSPRREKQECNAEDDCCGITACTALPSPQMCHAVMMDTTSNMRKLPQDCGQSPLVGQVGAQPPFATSVADILPEQRVGFSSTTETESCFETVRNSSDETRVPSDSEATVSRMPTGQEDNVRERCETECQPSCCKDTIETPTVASTAAQEFVRPETDILGQENSPASGEATRTQKANSTLDKRGSGFQNATDITRFGIPASFSFCSRWTDPAHGHNGPTKSKHSSALSGSSPLSRNTCNASENGGGAIGEPRESKGKMPSIRNSLALSLVKIRSWIARKSRGEKRMVTPQPGESSRPPKVSLEGPDTQTCDSQASTTNNKEASNVQVTSRAAMGSYALVIPIRIRVPPKSADLKEELWELAIKSAKDVHAIVNAQRPFQPSYALVPWHSITVYVGSIIDRLPLLRKLGGMKPTYRPSAFLISNGGKWDVTSVDTFMHQLLLEVAHMAKRQRSIAVYRLLRHNQLMEERTRLTDRKKHGMQAELGEFVVRNPIFPAASISGSPNRHLHRLMLSNRISTSPSGTRPPSFTGENIPRAVSASTHIKRSIRIEEVGGTNPSSRLLHLKKLPRTPTSARYGAPAKKTTATTATMAKTVPKFHPFSLKIESSWSVVAQHNVGLNYFAHNIVTVDGCLNWTLQYHTNMVSHELAMCYANRIVEILEKVCRIEEFKDNSDLEANEPHQHMTNLSTTMLPGPRSFSHDAEHPTTFHGCQKEVEGTMRRRLTEVSKNSNPHGSK